MGNSGSIALAAEGKFSFGKTFGPWALAVACSATTGGQYHYAHPYASFRSKASGMLCFS